MYYAPPDADSETLNLQDMIGDILENRWLVLGIATLVFLIGIALAITATPIYQADVLLQIEEKQSGLSELQISECIWAKSRLLPKSRFCGPAPYSVRWSTT